MVANTPGTCVIECPGSGDNDGDPNLEEGGQCDTHPNCPNPLGSPIILSSKGNRFQLTDAENGADFDLDNDGRLDRVAWTDADGDESFLVLARNGNGIIDRGFGLFGDFTEQPASAEPNGFEVLAVFDGAQRGGDQDGAITASDAVFASLLLWRDAKHDGIFQPEELRSPHSAGIAAISLRYHESRRRDPHGNQYRYFAFVSGGGSRAARLMAVDVLLVSAP